MHPAKGTVAILSISRNKARSARILGVAAASAALALGAASNAFACSISEFSAEASCDSGKGSIVVTDKDFSRTSTTITLFQGDKQVGQKENVKGSQEGVTVSFPVDWQPNTTYRVHVVKTHGGSVVGDKNVTTPGTACTAPEKPTPSASESTSESTPTPSASESTSDTPTPSASQSSTAAAAAPASNAPSPAVGDANLAETGANSNTGLIAGIAAALVVVGGGSVFFGLRRRGAKSAS